MLKIIFYLQYDILWKTIIFQQNFEIFFLVFPRKKFNNNFEVMSDNRMISALIDILIIADDFYDSLLSTKFKLNNGLDSCLREDSDGFSVKKN